MLRNVKAGAKLNIVIEAHGHQTFPTINDDFKASFIERSANFFHFQGLLSNVSVKGFLLGRWTQCSYKFDTINEFASRVARNGLSVPASLSSSDDDDDNGDGPGVYLGVFDSPMELDWSEYHTFFDSRQWGKGVLLINSLKQIQPGVYWPILGPQVIKRIDLEASLIQSLNECLKFR